MNQAYSSIPTGSEIQTNCKFCNKLFTLTKGQGAPRQHCNDLCKHRSGAKKKKKPRLVRPRQESAPFPVNYWLDNHEHLVEVLGKYDTRTEFKANYSGAYSRAAKLGLLSTRQWSTDKEKTSRPYGYWKSDQARLELVDLISKHKTFKDFQEAHPTESAMARTRADYDELIEGLDRSGNLFNRHVYIFTGMTADGMTAYCGITCNPKNRFKSHHALHKFKFCSVNYLSPLMELSEAVRIEKELVVQLRQAKDIECLNSVGGGAAGGSKRKWNEQKIFDACRSYHSLAQMCREGNKALLSAISRYKCHGKVNEYFIK